MLNRIKTVTQYSLIPSTAVYIGSENGAGELEEFFYDLIADAEDPIRYRDPEECTVQSAPADDTLTRKPL
jgi:hypothetical protein